MKQLVIGFKIIALYIALTFLGLTMFYYAIMYLILTLK